MARGVDLHPGQARAHGVLVRHAGGVGVGLPVGAHGARAALLGRVRAVGVARNGVGVVLGGLAGLVLGGIAVALVGPSPVVGAACRQGDGGSGGGRRPVVDGGSGVSSLGRASSGGFDVRVEVGLVVEAEVLGRAGLPGPGGFSAVLPLGV